MAESRLEERRSFCRNPGDLAAIGVASGERVRISSEFGTVEVISEADESLRRGVVSVLHGYGGLPGDSDYLRDGACVNVLISTDANLQKINGTPRMTGFPVAITTADRCNAPPTIQNMDQVRVSAGNASGV